MKKYIKMFDVGFGDCFVIHDETSSFLVDCGSKTPSAVTTTHQIVSLMKKGKERALLITHFHFDHISLLGSLPHHFLKTIYLRNIYRDQITYSMTFFQYLLLRFTKGPEQYDAALTALFSVYSLNQLLTPNGIFVFIRRGSTFQVGQTLYLAYSPFKTAPQDTHFGSFLEKLEQLLDCKKDIDTINRFGSKLIEQFGQSETISLEDHRFRENFQEYQDAEQAANNIGTAFERSENKKKIKKLAKSILAKSKDWEHQNNIVFSDEDRKLLMCGDEEAKDMNEILDDFWFKIPLTCVKVPHHGTPSHYVSFGIYQPKKALISNDNYAKYEKPDCHYLADFKTVLDTHGNMKIIHDNCPFLGNKFRHKYKTITKRTIVHF